jgi:hypothetical protein
MIILFAVVDIHLPHPRFMEIRIEKEFGRLCGEICRLLEEK